MKTLPVLWAVLAALSLTSPAARAVTVPPDVVLAAEQAITRQVPAEVESLDPAHIESWTGNTIALDLFEGLTRIDADGQVVPGVAQTWTRKTPLTWRFTLRRDAQWSNGAPVTAADFVYAWQRLADPKTGSKYTILVEFIKNAKDIIAGKAAASTLGVRALDAYTLEVTTDVPVAFFPELTAMAALAPVNKDVLARFGLAWTRPGHLVSNGAYQLSDWQPNHRVVLTRNAKYWNAPKVVIHQVTYLPIESDETAMRMYQAGQIDYSYAIPSGNFAQLGKQFGAELRRSPQLATYYYYLNNNDVALKDKRVREALSMVIDRDLLTTRLTQAGETPLFGLIPHGIKGARPFTPAWAAWPMAQRIAGAKDLLRQAGYSDAKPLSLTLTYNTNVLHKKVALFAASEWRTKLGIRTGLENVEFKVLMKQRHEGKVQIARDAWFADYNDATSFFDLIRCDSAQNNLGYCNKQVDALVDEASRQLDDTARAALLTRAHDMAMSDAPVVPLFQFAANRLVKPYVGGYSARNVLDMRASQDMYLIKH